MQKTAHELIASQEFKHLVSRRWTISVILTFLLFVIYYGFILLIAWGKPFLSQKIGDAVTLGVPLGILVIVGAWVLTAAYVGWANSSYDSEVARLKSQVKP